MTVLVVEDDPVLCKILCRDLTRAGYQVDAAESGATALEKASTGRFRVVLLDLGLPDMDGMAVCERLRRQRLPISIVVLTGGEEKAERALGEGADAFLEKPCAPDLVVRTIGAELRHPPAPLGSVFHVGRVCVDEHGGTVYVDGQSVAAPPLEVRALAILARRSPDCVTREELNAAWHVDVHVASTNVRTLLRTLGGQAVDDPPSLVFGHPLPHLLRRSARVRGINDVDRPRALHHRRLALRQITGRDPGTSDKDHSLTPTPLLERLSRDGCRWRQASPKAVTRVASRSSGYCRPCLSTTRLRPLRLAS